MREKTAKILMLLIGLAVAAGLVLTGVLSGAISIAPISCGGNSNTADNGAGSVPEMPAQGQLSVYFLDVGQGDCAVLVSPQGKVMLIDSGEGIYASRVKAFIKAIGAEHIDVAVGTHAHGDHIGAMSEVIDAFPVGSYIVPAVEVRGESSAGVEASLKKRGIEPRAVFCGDTIEWDKSCTVTVLSPVMGCEYSQLDANDSCLILRVEYGETAFVFAADATVHAEQLSMFHNEKEAFEASVLKVAHHGSTSSSSQGFIEAVGAELAIISVGRSNGYGHPDALIVNRLISAGCEVVRTDERGTIAVFSDGGSIRTAFQK